MQNGVVIRHPILVFRRSLFDASAQAAGQGGGADLAVDEGVAAGNGSAVYQTCESADLGHAQKVAALRKL